MKIKSHLILYRSERHQTTGQVSIKYGYIPSHLSQSSFKEIQRSEKRMLAIFAKQRIPHISVKISDPNINTHIKPLLHIQGIKTLSISFSPTFDPLDKNLHKSLFKKLYISQKHLHNLTIQLSYKYGSIREFLKPLSLLPNLRSLILEKIILTGANMFQDLNNFLKTAQKRSFWPQLQSCSLQMSIYKTLFPQAGGDRTHVLTSFLNELNGVLQNQKFCLHPKVILSLDYPKVKGSNISSLVTETIFKNFKAITGIKISKYILEDDEVLFWSLMKDLENLQEIVLICNYRESLPYYEFIPKAIIKLKALKKLTLHVINRIYAEDLENISLVLHEMPSQLTHLSLSFKGVEDLKGDILTKLGNSLENLTSLKSLELAFDNTISVWIQTGNIYSGLKNLLRSLNKLSAIQELSVNFMGFETYFNGEVLQILCESIQNKTCLTSLKIKIPFKIMDSLSAIKLADTISHMQAGYLERLQLSLRFMEKVSSEAFVYLINSFSKLTNLEALQLLLDYPTITPDILKGLFSSVNKLKRLSFFENSLRRNLIAMYIQKSYREEILSLKKDMTFRALYH